MHGSKDSTENITIEANNGNLVHRSLAQLLRNCQVFSVSILLLLNPTSSTSPHGEHSQEGSGFLPKPENERVEVTIILRLGTVPFPHQHWPVGSPEDYRARLWYL